jgi:flagellar hook-associated protein 3 FlgL
MRITAKMITAEMTGNIFRQKEALFKAQKKVATGKQFHRPSDDPVAMGRAMRYRGTLDALTQSQRNIEHGLTWLQVSETALDQAEDSLNDAVRIAADQSAGTLDSRDTAARQIAAIREELRHSANTRLGERFLYAGHQTRQAPFDHQVAISAGAPQDIRFNLAADATDATLQIRDATGTVVRTITLGDGVTPGSGGTAGINSVAWDGRDAGGAVLGDGVYTFTVAAQDTGAAVVDSVTYNGDRGDIPLLTGDRLDVIINSDGMETFGDLFERLGRLQQALQNPDAAAGAAQAAQEITGLEAALDRLRTARAEGAVKYQRLESAQDRLAQMRLKIEDALDATQNADMAEAITELKALETAYETTLASAARILQTSLIDFLR